MSAAGPGPPVGPPGGGPTGGPGALAAGALFAGLVVSLVTVPYAVPVDPSVESAAAAMGYHTATAHLVASGWIVLTALVFAVWGWRRGIGAPAPPRGGGAAAHPAGSAWPEVAFVAAVGLAVHWPWLLRRTGPFTEDPVFLAMLHRMDAGLRPFVDFEFLYAPLMAFAAHGWMTLAGGFSFLAYYGWVALLEAGLYATLAALLHRWIPDRRTRWASLLLLLALAANTLVAPNWSSTRRLLGLLALAAAASRPRSLPVAAGVGLLVGLQAAYSHDFGLAAAMGLVAVYGLAGLTAEGPRGAAAAAGRLAVAGGVSLVAWAAVCLGLQGREGMAAQLAELVALSARFGAGEAGFAFYWTLNSLALFALLVAAAAAAGLGLARVRRGEPDVGDFLLLGGLAFVGVGLKSGLNRSDVFHLNAPLLPLAVAVLLARRRRLLRLPPAGERLALAALVVTVATYVFGGLPGASHLAQGWVGGLGAAIAGPRPPLGLETRAPTLLLEQAEPDPDMVAMARFLAAPGRRERPVVFYQQAWHLPIFVGRVRREYLADKMVYSDARAALVREHLASHPDALVVMTRDRFDVLVRDAPDEIVVYPLTVAKNLARWLSTVHYEARETEQRLRDRRWRREVGEWVAARYRLAGDFGPWVVLEPAPGARPTARGARSPAAGP